jgi:hypothetical protein
MSIGNSLFDEEGAKIVEDLFAKAAEKNVQIHLPSGPTFQQQLIKKLELRFFGVSDPLCLSFSSSALHFSNYSFVVLHPVNWDDRHPLARAMASDFTVTWQFSQRELFFITYETPRQKTRTS